MKQLIEWHKVQIRKLTEERAAEWYEPAKLTIDSMIAVHRQALDQCQAAIDRQVAWLKQEIDNEEASIEAVKHDGFGESSTGSNCIQRCDGAIAAYEDLIEYIEEASNGDDWQKRSIDRQLDSEAQNILQQVASNLEIGITDLKKWLKRGQYARLVEYQKRRRYENWIIQYNVRFHDHGQSHEQIIAEIGEQPPAMPTDLF